MREPEWGDHFEHRLTLTRIPECKGTPIYEGGMDQGPFCADGCISFNNGDFHLPVGKLDEFISTLYEAAGLPAPVTLSRPGRLFERIYFGRDFYIRRDGAKIYAGLGDSEVQIKSAPDLAAYLVAVSDEAEAAAEAAEVEALAEVLREHGDCASLRWDAARAVLRAGYRREAAT